MPFYCFLAVIVGPGVSVWYFSLYCSLKTCHLVDWFGDLIRTSTMESLIPQLHSLTLEISHELSIQLGES